MPRACISCFIDCTKDCDCAPLSEMIAPDLACSVSCACVTIALACEAALISRLK
jgi:uncharacterized Fe-S center protein